MTTPAIADRFERERLKGLAAEEAVMIDDAEVMRIWRECGLPEYFPGNGGSNHKLVAFAKACAALRRGPA